MSESLDRSLCYSLRPPFSRRKRWLPKEMRVAPELDPNASPGPRRRRYALLINPFYRKDPNASFGKHVLTPSLR